MPTIGICTLCRKEKELLKSHYMPAALYSRHLRLTYATRIGSGVVVKENEIKARLLCRECETLFKLNGEDEVLKYIQPKLGKKHGFPLSNRLRLALSRDNHPEMPRYSGADLGMDMDKFAYFALSIVWRGTAHDWTLLDGTVRPRFAIGDFEPPIREYLVGGPMPPDTAVIVVVASDDESRTVWTTPLIPNDGVPCLSFVFLIRGVFFRVMMGRHLPQGFRAACCTSPRKCLWYGSAKHGMPEIMEIFKTAEGPGAPTGRPRNSRMVFLGSIRSTRCTTRLIRGKTRSSSSRQACPPFPRLPALPI
jgi:hypothetical protein